MRNVSLFANASRPALLRHPQTAGSSGHLQTKLLDNINFVAKSGDIVSFTGPNGAGKTTLFKVVHGILEPSAGIITVNGKTTAMINNNLGFNRRKTGRENITLKFKYNGWHTGLLKQKIDSIIEFSELGGKIDHPLASYSKGMIARLSFSIITSNPGGILIIDEGIGAVDKVFQKKATNHLLSYVKTASIVLIASHNRSLTDKICNREIQIENGRILHEIA